LLPLMACCGSEAADCFCSCRPPWTLLLLHAWWCAAVRCASSTPSESAPPRSPAARLRHLPSGEVCEYQVQRLRPPLPRTVCLAVSSKGALEVRRLCPALLAVRCRFKIRRNPSSTFVDAGSGDAHGRRYPRWRRCHGPFVPTRPCRLPIWGTKNLRAKA
jgi:hypothetical protein